MSICLSVACICVTLPGASRRCTVRWRYDRLHINRWLATDVCHSLASSLLVGRLPHDEFCTNTLCTTTHIVSSDRADTLICGVECCLYRGDDQLSDNAVRSTSDRVRSHFDVAELQLTQLRPVFLTLHLHTQTDRQTSRRTTITQQTDYIYATLPHGPTEGF